MSQMCKKKTLPPPTIEPVIFNNIDEVAIESAAKATKGSAGPSGMDADIWRRILCSKAFGKTSSDLCYAILKETIGFDRPTRSNKMK